MSEEEQVCSGARTSSGVEKASCCTVSVSLVYDGTGGLSVYSWYEATEECRTSQDQRRPRRSAWLLIVSVNAGVQVLTDLTLTRMGIAEFGG